MAESGCNEVWVYDLRANAPKIGKRTPLTRAHFADFEAAFGEDCNGVSQRTDQSETGRFRRFIREAIKARGDSLDIAWLKDDSAEDAADLPEPAVLAREAMEELNGALAELEALLMELDWEATA
jgi:type I restriction enzyme M protein